MYLYFQYIFKHRIGNTVFHKYAKEAAKTKLRSVSDFLSQALNFHICIHISR